MHKRLATDLTSICVSIGSREAGSRTSKRLKDARGTRRLEIRAGTRSRDCIARGASRASASDGERFYSDTLCQVGRFAWRIRTRTYVRN